jgi:hypothetical protein
VLKVSEYLKHVYRVTKCVDSKKTTKKNQKILFH